MSDPSAKAALPDRLGKRIRIALPIRVTHWNSQNQPHLEMACTYDISQYGARIVGLRCLQAPGEIVAVERGRSRVFCRVVWVGENNTKRHGQIGLQCIEPDKTMWEAELRDLEEAYEPILRENMPPRPMVLTPGVPSRRRTPRFAIDGFAELLRSNGEGDGVRAPVRDLGELGCLVNTRAMLQPGTNLKLVLKVASHDLALRGQVRHAAQGVGLGIEFHEIRKGDRSILQHILRKLAEQEEQQEKEAPPKARATAAAF